MKTTRAPFMPVTPDVDDDRLERLASSKGVGALVRPQPAGISAGQAGDTHKAAAPETVSNAEAATPRARMKTINLELPDYVWTDLKIRSAKEQVSVRHIIMTALKGQGVDIRDVDMIEDGRRLRGARAE